MAEWIDQAGCACRTLLFVTLVFAAVKERRKKNHTGRERLQKGYMNKEGLQSKRLTASLLIKK
eukprot:1159515-Pelagomonas_calceolata.AAC.6